MAVEQLVTVKQGMQPTFDGVKVGVVKIGMADGAPAIQFWIRTAEQQRKQAFREGQSVTLPGAGLLTVTSIQPSDGTTAGSATLTYDAGHATD
ncbi:hypothetical protein QF015_002394 [Paenarthrobacter sp. TE4293]